MIRLCISWENWEDPSFSCQDRKNSEKNSCLPSKIRESEYKDIQFLSNYLTNLRTNTNLICDIYFTNKKTIIFYE